MPSGWYHQTNDLIAYGRAYPHVHRRKDAFAQKAPGLRHRNIGHEWYQEHGRLWDLSNPFPEWLNAEVRNIGDSRGPDAAEERMASDCHDYLDRVWDDLTQAERQYREGFFVWLLYNPELLESWAGVDVLRGRIKRTIDGVDVWEESPETVVEYRKLRRTVSKNHLHRLRHVLDAYCTDSETELLP